MTSRVSTMFAAYYKTTSGFHDLYTPPAGVKGVLLDFSVNHNDTTSSREVIYFTANAHVTTFNLSDVSGMPNGGVFHWTGYEVFDHSWTFGIYTSGGIWSIVASGYEITP